MCVIVLLLTVKTFFFLRIFPTLTPIVVMLTNVFYDLRIFLLFYFILILLFSQLFAILGVGNLDVTAEARALAECEAKNNCPIDDELEEETRRFLKPKGGGGAGGDDESEDPA